MELIECYIEEADHEGPLNSASVEVIYLAYEISVKLRL